MSSLSILNLLSVGLTLSSLPAYLKKKEGNIHIKDALIYIFPAKVMETKTGPEKLRFKLWPHSTRHKVEAFKSRHTVPAVKHGGGRIMLMVRGQLTRW